MKGTPEPEQKGCREITSSIKTGAAHWDTGECEGLACRAHPTATAAAEQVPVHGFGFKAETTASHRQGLGGGSPLAGEGSTLVAGGWAQGTWLWDGQALAQDGHWLSCSACPAA